MKNFTTIDVITLVGIMASLALLLLFSGCNHGFYLQGHKIANANDPRECCQRLSLHQKEMKRFDRYCRVALFIYNSDLKDKKAKGIAKEAVRVCKYVFRVQSDEELLSVGELEREYNKVRHYITTPKDTFWRESLPCDPAEYTCEEF